MEKVKAKIKKIAQSGFFPKELLEFIEKVFLTQKKYEQEKIELSLPLELENYQKGKPLLLRQDFPFPWEKVSQLRDELLELAAREEVLAENSQILLQDLAEDSFWQKSVHKFLEGDDSYFRLYGEKLKDSPRLLNFLVQSSLTPFAVVIGQSVGLALPQEEYGFGHCPICGSVPFLSVLEKGGKRYNFCSFCLFKYPVARLTCAFCGQEQKEEHKYFSVEELPGYRVDICPECKKYIKTIDFRERDEVVLPALDDLASLPLDFLAQKEGYLRPSLSFWGF
ncbi:MAG: Formate dehydrogenase accessory protein [Desulfonauticus sp. 38_4375]|jgi:FdhE protein|nr:MAG: Formate dehydrogenase accessory protein [Desulfonauticus sp. 38_4375]